MALEPIRKYLGREVVVEFALTDPNAATNPGEWLTLGAARGKEWGAEWQTTDATTDDSPELTQENLVTYKTSDISFDGLATKDTTKNVDLLEEYVNAPAANGSETGYPTIYLRITAPRTDSLRTYTGTALLTSFRNNAPHDDVASWTMEGNSFAYTIATETAAA
ncbi:phage tail tube protein [Phytohalomonas tamaricis]|uniref:phage tail tube protein n=1 Tax=Phytohalomonas tamaricis TaxID=2081032 RepID=UPI000D0BC900|nr:phage tail tube protein [Phytohalomonas tamaricis]